MPPQAMREFHALLLGILDDTGSASQDDVTRSRALERIVEAARQLNNVTTALSPTPWSMPGAEPGWTRR